MGLSGLEIYKLLPKTNCKECGQPTCLAFAMKLAAKQADLSACPYVSEEAKAALERLRALCKEERFVEDQEAQAFLAEAEKLIEDGKQ